MALSCGMTNYRYNLDSLFILLLSKLQPGIKLAATTENTHDVSGKSRPITLLSARTMNVDKMRDYGVWMCTSTVLKWV